MRDHSIPNGLCSIDPISMALIGGTLAAGAGAAFGGGGSSSAPTPAAPPPQAPPQKTPAPKQQQQQASFMGGIPIAPSTGGQKTLLGQ